MKKIASLISAALVAAGVGTSILRADDANYQNYVVGERAAGMGGAVTASADGVDAVFYNPAGLADVPKNSISLSASLYGFQNQWVKGYWYPSQDLDVSSFVSIPTTFGSVWKLSDRSAVALAAFIPDRSSSNDLEAFVDTDHYFKFSQEDQTLWIGPSIGWRLDEKFSVGASLFGVYRTFSWFRDYFYANYWLALSEDIMYSNLSLLAVLGAKYDLDENWLLGLRLQTPNIRLTGKGNYLFKRSYFDSSERLVYFQSWYMDEVKSLNRLPTQLTAGVAYRVPGVYSFGADVSLHLPVSFNRVEGYDQFGVYRDWPLERKFTVDLSLGGEYFLADVYPVRLGLFTSRSSAPAPDVLTSYYPPQINKYGLTASVGRESENTTINLGLNYVWGNGKFLGFDQGLNIDVAEAEYSSLYLFLSSSYLF